MNYNGWISLHRKFLEWEWFDKSEMVQLFIYLLLKANHTAGEWHGIIVKRGQLITGIKKINKDTKISFQKIRTCLKRLELTHEINKQTTNKYSIITICNYDIYQTIQQTNNKEVTNKQQTSNKQLTTNNNNNKEQYKYNAFYDSAIENNGDLIDVYKQFVNFLFGNHKKNPIGKPLIKLLKMKDQIGYDNFCKLYAMQTKEKRLIDKCIAYYNGNYKNSSFFLTMNEWMKKDWSNGKRS